MTNPILCIRSPILKEKKMKLQEYYNMVPEFIQNGQVSCKEVMWGDRGRTVHATPAPH